MCMEFFFDQLESASKGCRTLPDWILGALGNFPSRLIRLLALGFSLLDR